MARDYKDHGQGRYYGLERTLTVILFLVFALAIATGILSFIRLNNVIHSVETSVRPDRSLILAKDIFSYLTAAENSVKSYSLTQREEDMVRFYSLTETMSAHMRELKDISGDDPYLVSLIDSLDRMVSKKFDILDQLLVIQDEYLVEQAMHQVMRNIREQEKAGGETTEEAVKADTVAEQDKKKRDSFFRRLFSKKKNKEEQPPDTIQAAEPAPPALTLEEISTQVEKAQQKALTDERLLREQELELFRQDNVLMNKIRNVLDEMEAREDMKLRANILLAEKEASEVKTIILTYGLAALLLLLLVAISIYTYIRRNTEYRKVLSEAKANAEDLARKKEGFLANMSHEIRTPMNIISGYLDLILKGKLAESQREKVEIVKKSSTHLIQLLNNLLDLSRVQAGKLKLLENEFSPGEIVSDMEKWFAASAKEKGLELETFVDPRMPQWIAGDPVRLRQILFNITSNAIKFTSSGKVSISISPVEQDQDKILTLLEVSDSGPGISKEDQQRIFEHFEQVHPSGSVVSEGSGLGLAITLQLVKLMDGDIELDSSPGQGSTFRIKIPFRLVRREKEEQLQISGHDRDLLNRLKVMVVDDEEYNRRLVRMMLEKYHCIIKEAESGEEAVKMAGKEGWDIIIMDIRMTGMGGLEAARAIKKNAGVAGNPVHVIAFSAGLTDKDHENLTKTGIDDFLSKPFEEQELIRTILKLARIGSPEKGRGSDDSNTRKVKEQKGESPGYDLTPLITSSNGNEKFLKEMITLFIENTDSGLQQIKEHLEREEWVQAADTAHKISGPCRHLKASALHGSLKNLEKSLEKNIDLKRSEGILKEAIMEFERIREDILARHIK